jgi:hypothetical protein
MQFCLRNVLLQAVGIQISNYVIVSICRDVPTTFVGKEAVSGACEIIWSCVSVCVRLECGKFTYDRYAGVHYRVLWLTRNWEEYYVARVK